MWKLQNCKKHNATTNESRQHRAHDTMRRGRGAVLSARWVLVLDVLINRSWPPTAQAGDVTARTLAEGVLGASRAHAVVVAMRRSQSSMALCFKLHTALSMS